MFGLVRTSFILLALVSFCTAQGQSITCYGVNGLAYPTQVQCPESNACCGVGSECLPNKLCKNPDDNDYTFVRGPCLAEPFDESCARICVYNETIEDNYFPRVTRCSDGSMCCSNDPQCCNNKRGRWLDDQGNLLASAPSTTSAQTTTSIASATPTEASTASSELPTSAQASAGTGSIASTTSTTAPSDISAGDASSKDESKSDNGEALALKVGLGLGIPLVAVIAAGAMFCLIWRRRKRAGREHEQTIHGDYQSPPPLWSGYPKGAMARYHTAEMEQRGTTHELQGTSMKNTCDREPGELMGSMVHDGPQPRRSVS